MNPDEKAMLKEAIQLSRDNNDILKGLRSRNRWATFFRILYWAVVLSIVFGAYYYLQPVISAFSQAFGGISDGVGQVTSLISSLPDVTTINNALDKIGN